MLVFNITLSVVLCGAIAFLLALIRKNLALSKLHKHIGDELSAIIQELSNVDPAELKRRRPEVVSMPDGYATGDEMLDDPGMLATIITAIISKYGDVRVGMTDFAELGDDSYISVYIDTNTQELLLSLNPNLTDKEEMPFEPFLKPDDGVFH